MKSSDFMDKRITEFSGSEEKDSFSFFNPDEDSDDELDAGPSYGFPLNRTPRASRSHSSFLRNSSSMDYIDCVKASREEEGVALVSEIDRIIKENFEDMLHLVSDLSARVTQLESKTSQFENAINDLKVSAEYYTGRTDGKLRQLENILREVREGIHFIRDKQEIAETQLQLDKIQSSKDSRQSEDHNTAVHTGLLAIQALSSTSEQISQPLPTSGPFSTSIPTLRLDAPSNLLYQNATPAGAPVHSLMLQNQIPSGSHPQSRLPAGKTLESTYQQYDVPPTHNAQPPPSLPQLYQPTPNHPQVPQEPQQPQLHPPFSAVNPQNHHPSWTHHHEETPLIPSHVYQPAILQPSSLPPVGLPIQQFFMDPSQQVHGQPVSRSRLEYAAGYSQMPGPANSINMRPYSESLSRYSSSAMQPSQLSRSSSVSGGESNRMQPLEAQVLPHAIPTASSVDSRSSSGGSVNKVPVDDVVDKVTTMGFRRDLVKATVRKLTENRQSVDLNVVLDKLMNNDRK